MSRCEGASFRQGSGTSMLLRSDRLKALVFAPSWPPTRSPRATMNHRLLQALDWQGCVWVAGSDRNPESTVNQLNTLRVHRLSIDLDAHVFNLLERLRLGLSDLPDRHLWWAMRTTRAALRRTHRSRVDLLVSISKPDSAHLAALAIKRQSPGLPWLAIFSDPWADLESYGYRKFNALTRRINRRLEARVLRSADAIVVTNPEARMLLLDRYPEAAAKYRIISQCFDPELYPTRKPDHSGQLVIRHLGDFYAERSPRPLLEALDRLHRDDPSCATQWRFELIGKLNCRDREQCIQLAEGSPAVRVLPEVSYRRSLELMVDADALLVIDAPAPLSPFLPSKLIEYLGANRPILALTPPGAAASLVREAGGLVAAIDRPEDVASVLLLLLDVARRRELHRLLPQESVRQRYSKHAVVSRMAALARSLVE